jgi:hypothetical protein
MLKGGEGTGVSRKTEFAARWLEPLQKLSGLGSPGRFQIFKAWPLVSMTGAFYNPRNTQAAAVVSFTRGPGTWKPKINGCAFPVGCLKIDLYSGISQEH